jgi:hypothetical protein
LVSFFKYQDPLRLGMILLLLIIIRLPVLLYGYPLLVPELSWLLTGEKMSDGFVLYKDIWNVIEPFSAGTYYLLDSIFGKSQIAYQVFSLILVFLQAVIFNLVLSANNLYPDRTYVPALLYIIFSSLFFDFYTLSPILMGLTFLIFTLHFIFFQIRIAENDENIFYTGALIAISSLFYFPFFIFLFFTILVFLLYSPSSPRKYILLTVGFIFPYLVVGVYYFWKDGLDSFADSMAFRLFSDTRALVSGKIIAMTLAIPFSILLLSLVLVQIYSRYINYQYIALKIFGFWLVFSVGTLYLTHLLSTFQLFIFVPAFAFFGAHYFLLVKNKKVREVTFFFTWAIILWVNYGILFKFAFTKNPVSYENMIVQPVANPLPMPLKDYKILVLGDNKSYYNNNKLATPYLEWKIAKRHFSDLDDYNTVSLIYENFSKDMPDIIIDENNITPKLFQRIPLLGNEYKKVEGNFYVRLKLLR